MRATGDTSANIRSTDADAGATDTNVCPATTNADANIHPANANGSSNGSCERCAVSGFPVGLPDLSQGYPCHMGQKYACQHPSRCGE